MESTKKTQRELRNRMNHLTSLIKDNLKIWVLASLTLGLAPFLPEPHIWGKLKWIAGGAAGMAPIDWFDALMHGAPWVLLLLSLLLKLKKQGI